MNAHVPQSVTTATEIMELAAVPLQMISARECKPIMGVVQDVALGIYRITKPHVMFTEKQMFNLMATNLKFKGVPEPDIKIGSDSKGEPMWSGRQLMSTIIPEFINLKTGNKSYDEAKPNPDDYVVIENGKIKQGTLDKTIYQSRTKGLVHSIFNDYGPQETRIFFDNTQRIICDFLVMSGFSVGISDLIIDKDIQIEIRNLIHDMKVTVYDVIHKIHQGQFENRSISNNNDYFEAEVNKLLNQSREKTGKLGLGRLDDKTNRMINMIKSGSKGSEVNVAQMIACLGQVNVDGKRIEYGFDDRTLPHFQKYDDGPDSRGFIENSFISGLSPQEFFFHSMGGREGLIDTAVKTSEVGYLQRKLVKAMEDCKVNYDFTVRNATGSIVQFLYGEDGMESTKIEAQLLPYIEDDYAQLRQKYLINEFDDFQYILDDKTLQEYKDDKKCLIDLNKHFEDVVADREYVIRKIFEDKKESMLMYPISFFRIINTAKSMFKP
ncbi:MAG: hypothetical protein ACK5XN_18280, partial [Bacteroidota bacterium]